MDVAGELGDIIDEPLGGGASPALAAPARSTPIGKAEPTSPLSAGRPHDQQYQPE